MPKVSFEEVDYAVAQNIKSARKEKGFSTATMAAALGISAFQYQKYERGINRLTIGRFLRVAEILGISIENLLPGDNQKTA